MTIDRSRRRRWSRLLVGTACAAGLTMALPGVASAAPTPPAAPAAGARSADAAQRAQVAWNTHGRPDALVVVRPTGIDVVTEGRLARRIPRSASTVRLLDLDRFLPADWLTITDGTARLSAAVVLTPGVTLDVAAPVTTLQLAGGGTAPEAASIYTGSGALALRGVTVTSVDRTSGQVMTAVPGRPFILVSPRGRLTATDATIADLGSGTAEALDRSDAEERPGVDFRAGSTGSLVRTSLLRNDTGLRLDGAQGVRLEDVTIDGSTGNGLVLRGDRGTTMSGVRTEHNGVDGVHVVGPSTDRAVTGVTTTGNGAYGVGIDRQTGLRLTGVTTAANDGGGVDVSQSSGVTMTDLTTADEPVGVFTHVNSSDIVLDRLTSVNGRRGVLVEKTTRELTVQDSTFAGATVAGVAVGGTGVDLRDLSVSGSRAGVRVERGAADVTATRLTVTGGEDGVVAGPGTSRLLLQDLRVDGVARNAVRSSSPDARIQGGRISGGSTGIDVDAATTISGTSIGLVDEGIRTYSPGLVHADDVDVNAASVGINTAAGSPFLLTRSRVHALEAVRGTLDAQGTNDLSLPPLNLLGAIGIPVVLLAVALQTVAALRGRRFGGNTRRTPPVLATTTATATASSTGAEPTPAFTYVARVGTTTTAKHRSQRTRRVPRMAVRGAGIADSRGGA